MKREQKFKIGDSVGLIANHESLNFRQKKMVGRIGVVLRFQSNNDVVIVDFGDGDFVGNWHDEIQGHDRESTLQEKYDAAVVELRSRGIGKINLPGGSFINLVNEK